MNYRRFAVALGIVLASATVLADETPTATILCYHVVESPQDTRFSISRERFREQLDYLRATGYNIVSLADLSDYIAGKSSTLPRNAVVITVDDGWRCTYTEIYPELKKFGFPFTVFVYPKFIGMGSYALTWGQIREMAQNGASIESHTFSHQFLSYRNHQARGYTKYQEFLRHELGESKRKIEKETGQPVRFLAYPYGDFDKHASEGALAAGYEAAVTCEFGQVAKGHDPFRLRRVVIDTKTSLDAFRRYLGNTALELNDSTPAAGALQGSRAPVVSARIADPKRLDPNSVGMALLSLGNAPYSYDPRDGTISMVVREPLARSRQRAVVWGTDRKSGKRVEASWTFAVADLQPDETPAAEIRAKAPEKGARETSRASRSSPASVKESSLPDTRGEIRRK